MNKEVFFIADLYESDLNGGAELVNEQAIRLLSQDGYHVSKFYARLATVDLVRSIKSHPIILGSFITLREDVKRELSSGDYNYIIYEHDHKYLPERNPALFENYQAPPNAIVNLDLYKNATRVLCQSEYHKDIVDRNLELSNTVNLGSSLWSQEFLEHVGKINIKKTKTAAIIRSSNPVKNQKGCEDYCIQKNIPYDVIEADSPLELAKKMSSYEYLVFFPTVPESLCRVAVEAKMVGCKVITNKLLGASSERWFRDEASKILDEMKKAPQKTLSIIKESFHEKEKKETTHFKIVVPFYNAEDWIEKCINSIKTQAYKNFQCVVINDASTDNSDAVVRHSIGNDVRFVYHNNEKNVGALENIYNGINSLNPADEDVIVTLDGDDWLANNAVLGLLDYTYKKQKCWLTYGSYIEYPEGTPGKFSKTTVPDEIILKKSFRESVWMTSALRTFKYFLWKNIEVEDLKNTQGNFYEAAWDLAFMFPMLEMAGSKIFHVKDYVYVYNLGTPINDHKVPEKRNKQLLYEQEIRKKKKYSTFTQKRPTRTLEVKSPDAFVVTNPVDLLTPLRLDIAAKTLYARHREKGVEKTWAHKVYSEHLRVWGGHKEINPPKNGIKEFCDSFADTFASIKEKGFVEEESYIPVAPDNSPLNGAHRIATAIVCNEPVICKPGSVTEGQYDCSYNYFSNKKDIVEAGLTPDYTDAMVREYVKVKKGEGIFVATLYAHCFERLPQIMEIFYKNNVKVVSNRFAQLPPQGQLNYIIVLYGKESWLGNTHNNYPGAYEQAAVNFEKGNQLVFSVLEGTLENVAKSKEQIRDLIGVGKRSIHTTDTPEEAIRNTYTAYHDPTLQFLCQAKTGFFNSPQFQSFINETKDILQMSNVDEEDICVGGSAALAAYGIRECRDFDIVHRNSSSKILFSQNVSSHNPYLDVYPGSLEDILYHPNNHIFIDGIKFLSMQNTVFMKKKRGEEKDWKDITLIREYSESLQEGN